MEKEPHGQPKGGPSQIAEDTEVLAERLKRRMAWEGKKVTSYVKGLGVVLDAELEVMKREILQAIRQVEHSVELIAQELGRRDEKNDKEELG